MGRASVAVGAAVLASSVRIKADVEGDVWTVILGDDALGVVPEESGLDGSGRGVRIFGRRLTSLDFRFPLNVQLLETIGRRLGSTASSGDLSEEAMGIAHRS